ncbi:MAG TPA: hypothetical protein VGO93_16520 [Candidatus Xenobia bacterium]
MFPVNEAGYEVHESGAVILARQPVRVRWFEPSKKQRLFLILAGTPPTMDGMLRFANEYGTLRSLARPFLHHPDEHGGVVVSLMLSDLPPEKPGRRWIEELNRPRVAFKLPPVSLERANTMAPAELNELVTETVDAAAIWSSGASGLPDWKHQVEELAPAVELWELLRDGDQERLKQRLEWTVDGCRFKSSQGVQTRWHKDPLLSRQRIDPLRRKHGAQGLLLSIVNRHLLGLKPELVATAQGPRLVFARRLIDAIWLQFSEAVAKGRVFRECGYCGEALEDKAPQPGQPQLYCTESHRKMASRRRRTEAAAQLGGRLSV